MERAARAGEGEASPAKSFEVVRLQLEQLLDVNGLRAIEATGVFDPQVHRALSRVTVTDPARHQQIVEVLRAGFRTEQAVLRFAEVSVGHHLQPDATAPAAPTPPLQP
jgi:molecular chaperone GrpE (heat shock protein)